MKKYIQIFFLVLFSLLSFNTLAQLQRVKETPKTPPRLAQTQHLFDAEKSEVTVPVNHARTDEGVWIHWDDGSNTNGIGTNGVANFHIASRWEPGDISSFHGHQITRISFFPRYADCVYTVKIWVGADVTEVYSQQVASITLNDWNNIELATPYTIDASVELWFGVNINTQGGHPAGCDSGPAVAGKGNMIYWAGAWVQLTDLNAALNYNWNLQAYVESSQTVSLNQALDNFDLSFSTGGDAQWFGQTSYSHDGVDAARSGAISHSQSSWMETTLQGPGNLSFWWSVSSESGYDYLSILLNGSQENAISGEVGWSQVNLSIPSGNHSVRWLYSKDGSESSGQDCGWVDQVQFTPSGQSYSVTFNVDMSDASSFDPSSDVVYLTGSFTSPSWAEPGTSGSILMTQVSKAKNKTAPYNFYESFEDYQDFTTDLTPWITYQLTSGNTYSSNNFDFPGEGTEFAFMVFNPSQTSPSIEGSHPAYDGDKYALAAQYTGLNDDKWLITPQLSMHHTSQLSFYVKSITDAYGLERFRVLVSTTGTNPSDFTKIHAVDYYEAPTDWTEFYFDLGSFSGQTVYIAIQYVSYDAFFFMLDEFEVSADVDDEEIFYTATVSIPSGSYEYKYFMNTGWGGGEWSGTPNRPLNVTGNMTVDDVWGMQPGNLPSVTTANPSNITQTSATLGGNVTSDGGSTVTQRGVCWSTSENPTLSNQFLPSGSGTGSFSINISGLTPDVTYYVRAFATNSNGTAYGNQVSFTTQSGGTCTIYANTPTGPTTPCAGSAVTYSTSSYPYPAQSYDWQILPTIAGTLTQSGSSATITWSLLYSGPAQIRVRGNYGTCENPWSSYLTVNVRIDDSDIVISGETNVCVNSEIIYSLSRPASNYTWVYSGGSPSNPTNQDIRMLWNTAGNGLIRIIETVSGSCPKMKNLPITVSSSSAPTKPVIYHKSPNNVNILICTTEGVNYKWLQGKQQLQGETNQYYVARNQIGVYNVMISNSVQCPNTSNDLIVSGYGVAETMINLYPNPTSTHFFLELESEETGNAHITISNRHGVVVHQEIFQKTETILTEKIRIMNWSVGVYVVSVRIGNSEPVHSKLTIIR